MYIKRRVGDGKAIKKFTLRMPNPFQWFQTVVIYVVYCAVDAASLAAARCWTQCHLFHICVLYIEYTFVLNVSDNELYNFGPAVWLWQFSNGIELMVIRLCTNHAPIIFEHANIEPSLFSTIQHCWSASKIDQVLRSLVEIYYCI